MTASNFYVSGSVILSGASSGEFKIEDANSSSYYARLNVDAAADTLALRGGTNAQTFRIYNTYTDGSNYERAALKWSSNVFYIGPEAAGTGNAYRSYRFGDASNGYFQYSTSAGLAAEWSNAANLSRISWLNGNMTFECGTVQVLKMEATQFTVADAVHLILGTTTGTKIGTSTSQKLGFYNATPVAQQATTGTTAGWTIGAGSNGLKDTSTFTGNTGSTAYTVGDIVLALKNLGLLAA